MRTGTQGPLVVYLHRGIAVNITYKRKEVYLVQVEKGLAPGERTAALQASLNDQKHLHIIVCE